MNRLFVMVLFGFSSIVFANGIDVYEKYEVISSLQIEVEGPGPVSLNQAIVNFAVGKDVEKMHECYLVKGGELTVLSTNEEWTEAVYRTGTAPSGSGCQDYTEFKLSTLDFSRISELIQTVHRNSKDYVEAVLIGDEVVYDYTQITSSPDFIKKTSLGHTSLPVAKFNKKKQTLTLVFRKNKQIVYENITDVRVNNCARYEADDNVKRHFRTNIMFFTNDEGVIFQLNTYGKRKSPIKLYESIGAFIKDVGVCKYY